jgi:hypothetical protein
VGVRRTYDEGFGAAALEGQRDGAPFCGGSVEETGCGLGFGVVGGWGFAVGGGRVAVEELVYEGAAAGLVGGHCSGGRG